MRKDETKAVSWCYNFDEVVTPLIPSPHGHQNGFYGLLYRIWGHVHLDRSRKRAYKELSGVTTSV